MKPPADVQKWAAVAAEGKALVALERELRAALVAKYFPAPTEGTNVIDVGQGYELATVISSNFKLDGEQTKLALARICRADPAGPVLADRLVKWTPELRVGEWKKLPPKLAKMIAAALTIKPATPTLELRAPTT